MSGRTIEEFDALIDEAGMAPARDLIHRRALKAFRVVSTGKADETPGATRFGGLPDLPPGSEWPLTLNGERVQFLAQLDLADVARRYGPSDLPQMGLLSLFAGGLNDPQEFAVKALFNPPGAPLIRLQPPDGVLKVHTWRRPLNPIGVAFEPHYTLPNDGLFWDDVDAAAPGCDWDTVTEENHPERRVGQLLGHSWRDSIQAIIAMDRLGHPRKDHLLGLKSWEDWEDAKKRMKEDAKKRRKVKRSWPWSKTVDRQTDDRQTDEDDDVVRWILANRERIVTEMEQWQLLLELESNNEMGLRITDSIDICIRSDDLKAGDFTRVRAMGTLS
jgi:hypothetical protein